MAARVCSGVAAGRSPSACPVAGLIDSSRWGAVTSRTGRAIPGRMPAVGRRFQLARVTFRFTISFGGARRKWPFGDGPPPSPKAMPPPVNALLLYVLGGGFRGSVPSAEWRSHWQRSTQNPADAARPRPVPRRPPPPARVTQKAPLGAGGFSAPSLCLAAGSESLPRRRSASLPRRWPARVIRTAASGGGLAQSLPRRLPPPVRDAPCYLPACAGAAWS